MQKKHRESLKDLRAKLFWTTPTEATKFELGRLDIHGMHAWVASSIYSVDRPTYRCLIGANLLQKQHILSNGLSTFDTL